MKIGIDIDDTITLSNEKIVEEAFKFDKEYLQGKGFRDKDAYYFKDMMYWNEQEVSEFLKYIRRGMYFYNLEEKDNSHEIINYLYDKGIQIYFITRRHNSKNTKSLTKKWLKKHGFKYHKIYFNVIDKGKLCSELDIDLFIDNEEGNVYQALEYNIDSLLIDTKYNKNVSDLKRVNNWDEILKYIEEEYHE